MNNKPTVRFQDLGLKDYQQAWDYQHTLLKKVIEHKRHNRNLTKLNSQDGEANKGQALENLNYLLFCEHPPVYTLGKSGSLDHLLLNEQQLDNQGIDFYKINRGGDITFHGPGQVVGYPIFDLDLFFTDLHKYVRYIEEVIIRTLKEYEIAATRIEGFTGVWIEGDGDRPNRKICAIGVHLSRWVTMHGFALNANTKLQYFNNIIPCGINDADKEVTSLSQELGMLIDMDVLKNKLKYHFKELFGFDYLSEV